MPASLKYADFYTAILRSFVIPPLHTMKLASGLYVEGSKMVCMYLGYGYRVRYLQ